MRKLIKESEVELQKYLKLNKDASDKFNLNKKLIDFKNIPKKYVFKVNKLIKEIIKE